MSHSNASVTVYLDKRYSNNEGEYSVKLSVYYAGIKHRYKTGVCVTESEWLGLKSFQIRDTNLKIKKRKLTLILEKAQAVIDSMHDFSYSAFEGEFLEEKRLQKSILVKDLFEEYIRDLENNDQVGTAISYRTTKNSLLKFKTGLKLIDVNRELLHSYEKYMTNSGLSPTTIGINLRQLRCILNRAITRGLMQQDKYPFKGYSIPASRNIKKALNEDQIKALLLYETEDVNKRKALDFWLFSYISNGMNMSDICQLQPVQVGENFFHFIRSKTKNTRKKDLRPIKVPLTERTRQIIDKWRNRDFANPYLFPVLQEGLTARQIKFKIQDFIYFINQQMKEVAKELKIEAKVGTYVARHSHSTILKRKGAPTELIKENLGHSSILTTESYLDDFTDDVKMDYAKLLTEL